MLLDFDFSMNTKFIFGKDAHRRVGQEIGKLGVKSILLHHDNGQFLYESKLLEQIKTDMTAQGIQVYELGGVLPNPRLSLVYEGIEIIKKEKIEFVLAVGGGSSIDSAKAIAAGACYEGDVWDFFVKGKQVERALPVGVVLTYPATGSESSNVTVVNNAEQQQKLLTSSSVLQPALAFMNPELTYSLPKSLTASGIVDMFSHICERYFTPDTRIGAVDRMATGILKTLVEVGPKLLQEPRNYEYRAEVMWIGTIAHNDTVGVGRVQDWATHEIGNELSALYDTPHGITLSVIMGSWMRYVYQKDLNRFAHYANEVFDIEWNETDFKKMAIAGIERTEAFFKTLGMPISFSEAKVPTDEIDQMIEKIAFRGENKAIGGFMELNAKDVRAIFEMACK